MGGQTVNVSLVNLVEDFYDLDPTPDEEDQQMDYFKEDSDYSLATDYSTLHGESLKDNSNITMRSVKCKLPEIKNPTANCNCNCDQTCEKTRAITSRRICLSSHPHVPDKNT